jgi:hypothetical protein
MGYSCAHPPAHQPFFQGARRLSFGQFPANIEQLPISDFVGTTGLTGAACQASIQPFLEIGRNGVFVERFQVVGREQSRRPGHPPFEHLLYQEYATARPVPFVIQQPKGGTDERALSALHAGLEKPLGLLADIRVSVILCELDLH